MSQRFDNLPHGLRIAAVLAMAIAYAAPGYAAPINYGDFSGSTVMYLDVTETANSPGDSEPLFGAPTISGTQLDFDPAGFHAVADTASSDFTDGQLNIELMPIAGGFPALALIQIDSAGDYSLLGSSALAAFASGLSVTVLEVDGAQLSVPVRLSGAASSGQHTLGTSGSAQLSPWSLSLFYNVGAALTAASVPFINGATRLEIVIDQSVAGISDAGSIGGASVKDFSIRTILGSGGGASPVPEPGTALLVGLGLLGLAARRRDRAR